MNVQPNQTGPLVLCGFFQIWYIVDDLQDSYKRSWVAIKKSAKEMKFYSFLEDFGCGKE